MMKLNTGRLRHRVRIERPVPTAGEGGGAAVVWQPIATVWALVAAVGGREPATADAPLGRSHYDVTMRYRADVDPSMRLVLGTRVLDVITALDLDGRRRWLICRAEERTA